MKINLTNTELSFFIALTLIVVACFLALGFLRNCKQENDDELDNSNKELINQNKRRTHEK